ncbi:hypothetical protein [Aminobacter carboxidus]|uniref:Uncharacterized protein n=1 Tax=Aminobacter carboxidus TaxID=376165 RepID=A0ABR9GTQ9_9HYPH|nr:hypothetical protein [Aminobacter carboxidus]MBE1207000.1 hypothetical protein [Aminobacter carboxidus]
MLRESKMKTPGIAGRLLQANQARAADSDRYAGQVDARAIDHRFGQAMGETILLMMRIRYARPGSG